ncbi:MAG: hypothetical protein ACTHQQ_17650, partial [Solirubrobacteraceae bacterium]
MLTAASYHAASSDAAFILATAGTLCPVDPGYGIPGGPPSEAIKAEKLSPAAVGNELSPSFCASGWLPTPEPHPISIPV